jgi:hypothetical protein
MVLLLPYIAPHLANYEEFLLCMILNSAIHSAFPSARDPRATT